MTITDRDRQLFLNGEVFELEDEIYDFLLEEEEQKVKELFNCEAFEAVNSNGYTIIFHKCSKKEGFQISYFTPAMEAISDLFAVTKNEIMKKFIDNFSIYNITIQGAL